ncbi:Protein of unknown function [Lactobacillus helveticus CIRM-BIA 951]|uniref:Uncharacterized protein n=1 Tax=Lactobacillus helveticus CIRM-BIA 951 TaxID=1226334 RepID=U6F577_LACHE|nr:Protein of unknown function [Lactobacillus helveticus CIRM-BIA 951]
MAMTVLESEDNYKKENDGDIAY